MHFFYIQDKMQKNVPQNKVFVWFSGHAKNYFWQHIWEIEDHWVVEDINIPIVDWSFYAWLSDTPNVSSLYDCIH